jgi:hypothetical protein
MSLVLAATLIWGGCISCEQYFMFGTSKACCNPDGRCKTKAPVQNQAGRECKQIAFDHQKGIDLHFDLPVSMIGAIEISILSDDSSVPWRETDLVDPSPPDRQALHSVFLI